MILQGLIGYKVILQDLKVLQGFTRSWWILEGLIVSSSMLHDLIGSEIVPPSHISHMT